MMTMVANDRVCGAAVNSRPSQQIKNTRLPPHTGPDNIRRPLTVPSSLTLYGLAMEILSGGDFEEREAGDRSGLNYYSDIICRIRYLPIFQRRDKINGNKLNGRNIGDGSGRYVENLSLLVPSESLLSDVVTVWVFETSLRAHQVELFIKKDLTPTDYYCFRNFVKVELPAYRLITVGNNSGSGRVRIADKRGGAFEGPDAHLRDGGYGKSAMLGGCK